jgi:ABC-2 type transport system permease protein
MDKIKTIIRKEWAEVFRNPIVLFTVLLLPLLFTVMPLVILYFMSSAGDGGDVGSTDMPAQFTQVCNGLTGMACTQVYIIYQFMMMFMLLPVIIPVAISAYSIVGEKTTRALEPLLATPITTLELLLGKGLAAALPAIGASWAGFVVFAVGVRVIVPNPAVFARLFDPLWLIAVLVVGPLMSVAAVNVSIIVSSRVSDPRTAEQVSMIVIVPLLGLFFGQVAGLFLLNVAFILVMAVVVLAIDAGLVYLGVSLFQRETILPRWK